MSYGIRKFWCWIFTQHTSFYLTSYVTDMNSITHRRFFVHLYQPIHWYLPRILTFLSEQRAPISIMFAELPTTWYNHSIVTCKFQYSWRVWTSPVRGRDCMSHLLWHAASYIGQPSLEIWVWVLSLCRHIPDQTKSEYPLPWALLVIIFVYETGWERIAFVGQQHSWYRPSMLTATQRESIKLRTHTNIHGPQILGWERVWRIWIFTRKFWKLNGQKMRLCHFFLSFIHCI